MATEILFSGTGLQEIIARLDRLAPESLAQWGKMDVSQMLHHCQKPLEVAVGDETLRPGFVAKLIGPMFRRKLSQPGVPFSRNSPTAPTFRIVDQKDFAVEKSRLLDILDRFVQLGKSGKLADKHPFFGTMTNKEWEIMQWKHLDHHLRQFGQ